MAAQKSEAKHSKDVAALLRAAEHLNFGALQVERAGEAHPKLLETITEEFGHKLSKADEHWSQADEHHSEVHRVYTETRFPKTNVIGRRLELARGAEALAHVTVPTSRCSPTVGRAAASNREELLHSSILDRRGALE